MSTDEDQKPSILLLGAYGRGNIGDDVFIICAIELFKNYNVFINSANDYSLPKEARDTNTVRTISTTGTGDVLQKVRLFLKTKIVVYWGGDLWVELYGSKNPKQLLYKMIILNSLLRLFGKKIYYIGCGIGALDGYSLKLARLSAGMAEKNVLREQRSNEVLQMPNTTVLPDIAINLPFNKPTKHVFPKTKPFSIVISVLWSIPDPENNFPLLIKSIANLVNSLPAEDFEVTLLPMHISTDEEFDDVWASKQLNKLLDRKAKIYKGRDLESVVACLRECDLLIGSRLHTNILAILNGTPSIGLAYRPKVSSFFADNDLKEYCLDLNELDKLKAIFDKIYNHYPTSSKQFYEVGTRNFAVQSEYKKLIDSL